VELSIIQVLPIRAIHTRLQLDPLDDIAAVIGCHAEILFDDPVEFPDFNALYGVPAGLCEIVKHGML
jgi:hypothetical protein